MNGKPASRDIGMHISWGDIRCSVIAEGRSWSPDVADDMVNRMGDLWENTLRSISDTGHFDGEEEEEDEEDEYGPTPSKELIDPYVIRLSEDGEVSG
jgi:hypothetical protein